MFRFSSPLVTCFARKERNQISATWIIYVNSHKNSNSFLLSIVVLLKSRLCELDSKLF